VGTGVEEGLAVGVAVAEGVGLGGSVASGTWVGVASPASTRADVAVGSGVTSMVDVDPQAAAPQRLRSATSGNSRCMVALAFCDDLEKVAKGAPCQVVIFTVACSYHRFDVVTALGQAARRTDNSFGNDWVILWVELNAPHRVVLKPIGLHGTSLSRSQQYGSFRQLANLIPMPQKRIKGLAGASQQRVGQTRVVDLDRQPADLPTSTFDLAAKPIGKQLVAQADAKNRHIGFQGFRHSLPFGPEDGIFKVIRPILAAGENHRVIGP
jgi:hypothetical protein